MSGSATCVVDGGKNCIPMSREQGAGSSGQKATPLVSLLGGTVLAEIFCCSQSYLVYQPFEGMFYSSPVGNLFWGLLASRVNGN